MSVIAVYPGTFDPLTNGHEDVVLRALELFDTVLLAVATSSRKEPHFDLPTRVAFCEQVFAAHSSVRVLQLEGRLVDFVQEHGARCIVRGLRSMADCEYEMQMAGMNRLMAPQVETLFLPAQSQYSAISGTFVRELLAMGQDVSAFVPKAILESLRGTENY